MNSVSEKYTISIANGAPQTPQRKTKTVIREGDRRINNAEILDISRVPPSATNLIAFNW